MHGLYCLITLAKSTHNGRQFVFSCLIFGYVIVLCVNLKTFTQANWVTIYPNTDLGVLL